MALVWARRSHISNGAARRGEIPPDETGVAHAGAAMTALAEQIGWITRLVGFDTSSGRSNLPLIEAIEDYLSGLGIASHRVASPDGSKANLYAVIGPHAAGGIVLS